MPTPPPEPVPHRAAILALIPNPELRARVQSVLDDDDGLTDTERLVLRVLRERTGPHLPRCNGAMPLGVVEDVFVEVGARRCGLPVRPAPPRVYSRTAAGIVEDTSTPPCARCGATANQPCDLTGEAQDRGGCARDDIDVPVVDRATGDPLPPAPAPPPRTRSLAAIPDEEVRDSVVTCAQQAGGLTRRILEDRLRVSRRVALIILRDYIERGIIKPVGDRRRRGFHYAYVQPPSNGPTTHPRSDHPRVDPTKTLPGTNGGGTAPAARAQPVEGTGRKDMGSSDPAVKKLLSDIVAAGGEWERLPGGHLRATGPNGRAVFASTPSNVGSMTRGSVRKNTGLDIPT